MDKDIKKLNDSLINKTITFEPVRTIYTESECPKCKRTYRGEGALSRKDNETEICSDCGTAEALMEHILGGF